ncbi:MAG TPA: [FeFe] hydrogenase H-cluster radical SAM maturase HydG [candidate division Zixibacteria bacterium]|nr:[FeFe] hydrogenase H-cluster radical SAM maturase HydG [candidate division Zixibacteria bacterium]
MLHNAQQPVRPDGPRPLKPIDNPARFFHDGHDFIDDALIHELLEKNSKPEPSAVREVIAKARSLQRLEPAEAALLANVTDEELWEEIFAAAADIRQHVYGPRVVTFAPVYCGNICENSCLYCGFRAENKEIRRMLLNMEELAEEIRALVKLGHKRSVLVFGEHRRSGVDYIQESIKTVYNTKVGNGEIRRVNINAAPMTVDDYKVLHDVGIGTFQVFQETYHHETYKRVHPRGPKSNYPWRLYALHRAQEAGIDDVAIGALLGLYDWRFELLGLLYHTIDLEKTFGGIGPHTISFPRLRHASGAPLCDTDNPYLVSDRDFLRMIAVIRLMVPYTGMIITAREPREVRMPALKNACTQTDASTRIGLAGYAQKDYDQDEHRQQFMLGDTRELDEVVCELAEAGFLTSFCTAGYRCGRTGSSFMAIARKGEVHKFCIPNAILTLAEYLRDYASPKTKEVGEKLIQEKIAELSPGMSGRVSHLLEEVNRGGRDIRL